MMRAVKDYFTSKGTLHNNTRTIPSLKNCRVKYYDLHDGKILYILAQHLLWNRKHHTFLLCQCYCGDDVKNDMHECTVL